MDSALRWPIVLIVVVLACSQPSRGGEPVQSAALVPQTVEDVLALLSRYQPDATAISKSKKRLALPLPDESVSRDDRIRDLLERAAAAAGLGDQALRLRFARAAGALQGDSRPGNRLLQEWANAEEYAGNVSEGIRLRELSRTLWRSMGGGRIADNSVLADAYASLGDLETGRRLLAESEAIYRGMRYSELWKDNEIANIDRARGDAASREGRYADAEGFYRKAYEAAGRDIEKNRRRRSQGMDTMSEDVVVSMRDLRGVKLANTLLHLGRIAEAEWQARELIRFGLEYSGRSHPSTARSVALLAKILTAQGRLVEGEALARTSLKLLIEAGTTDPSSRISGARLQIGEVLVAREHWNEAIVEFDQRTRGVGEDPALRAQIKWSSMAHGIALLHVGRFREAEVILEASHQRWRATEGERGTSTATALGFAALARGGQGDTDRALRELSQAFDVLEVQQRFQDDAASERFESNQRFRWLAEGYLALLARQIEGAVESQREPLVARAFSVADAVRRTSVQKALSASSARAAIRDPALAELARQEQDAGLRAAALNQILTGILGRPPEQRLPKVESDMRRDIDDLRAQRNRLRQRIEREFPSYASLVSPRLVPLTEVGDLLKDSEVLVAIYSGRQESYAWAVRKQGATGFIRSGLSQGALASVVARLRKSVELGDIAGGSIPHFDFDAAHALYAALLEPLAPYWRTQKSLIVAAGGELGQLPLSMLIETPYAPASLAEREDPNSGYQKAPWLARDIAVTRIPSVLALADLRRQPPANPSRLAFAGFGDPQFRSNAADNSSSAALSNVRRLGLRRARNLTVDALMQAADGQPSPNPATTVAIPYDVIPALPDTRDEVLAIAAALGANPVTDVFLGRNASVRNVQSAGLAHRKIIAFATHGLLAGEFPGVDEPALALANPGNGAHGLLTLSQILQLKLDADWVVLSACNTAAGDSSGADAVSGLGRGFFYAGSRALLVTHWPVESASAKALVSGVFERYARDPNLPRAEALRQAMLAMIDSPAGNLPLAHPAFWAPYDLVGDGSR